jgi:glycosyltransferase involved in cell wall biosynthesis
MKHLAQRHDISWISRQLEGSVYSRREFEALGIRTLIVDRPVRKKSGPRFFLSLMANAFSAYPYVVSSHFSKQMAAEVERLCLSQTFDLVHCEWTPYAANMPPMMSHPTVAMAHNVESVVWRRYQQVERNPLRKLFMGLQAGKMERFERQALPRFSRIISVSDQDKKIISRWVSQDKVAVVPNGVDTDFFRKESLTEAPESLVFVGSLDWRPNVDGVVYFLDQIWPLVRSNSPGARLAIVGRNPLPALKSRIAGEQGVEVHGSVEDVRPFLNLAQVCIVPLRIGSGSRIKILEAFAMETPVVATSVGAEGLEVADGKHLLIADNPADFADAVKKLFLNPSHRQSLSFEGRRLVVERYSWPMLAKQLETEWQKAVLG